MIAQNKIEAIRRCWNAGMTLSQASKFLQQHGVNDTKLLIAEWRQMKKLFGCRSVPFSYLKNTPERSQQPTAQELAQKVSPVGLYGNGSYGDWKGLTGPGALLKTILKEGNQT
jgi:hypothetical protein